MMAKFFVGVVIIFSGDLPPEERGLWLPYDTAAECFAAAPGLSALERARLPAARRRDAEIRINCVGKPPPGSRFAQ